MNEKKAKRKPRRSASQIAKDRRRVSELYLRGELQADIAEEVGRSQSTVCRDLQALQAQWLKDAAVDFDTAKAKEIAKIDNLERTYHSAWQRSCEDAETLIKDGTPEKVEKLKRTSKGQAGDPRFLQGVQWCIEKRCKILGIEEAIKQQNLNLVLGENAKLDIGVEVNFPDLDPSVINLLMQLEQMVATDE